jgi:hypothetical protein
VSCHVKKSHPHPPHSTRTHMHMHVKRWCVYAPHYDMRGHGEGRELHCAVQWSRRSSFMNPTNHTAPHPPTLNTHSHAHAREEMVRICATLRYAGTRRGQRTALCSAVNPTNHTAPHPPTLQNPMLWKQLACRGPIHLGHTHCRSAATETLSGFAFSSSSEEIMML